MTQLELIKAKLAELQAEAQGLHAASWCTGVPLPHVRVFEIRAENLLLMAALKWSPP